MRNRARGVVAPLLLAAALVAVGPASASDRAAATPSAVWGYTIQPISPLTQSWPTIDFLGPYFFFLLRNTAAQPDSFRLRIANLTEPGWFPQVCLRAICFPDSTTIRLNAGAADTVGVNIVPFFSGVGEADFLVSSVGDPGLQSQFHVVLYAGSAAVSAPALPVASSLRLAPSFPNPTRGPARIAFALPREDRVTLRVLDVAGRHVATLVDGSLPAGPHAVEWSGELLGGRPAPAGTYFYRLETPQGALSRRLVLLR